MRRLSICVDDFGLHRGVNAAAVELVRGGRITAISCLVGAPSWQQGCHELRNLNAEKIDIGLHLDFTEYPMDEASRYKLPWLILLAYLRDLDPSHLRAEIHAQFDAFEAGLGRAPDHVDGHRHVHQLPGIRDEILNVLRERYPHRKPWLRSACPPDVGGASGDQGGLHQFRAELKARIIALLGSRSLMNMTSGEGYPHNEHLLGSYDFRGDRCSYEKHLSGWLRQSGDRDLLMCHPSMDVDVFDDLLQARIHEYEALSDVKFPQMLLREGIVLAPLSRTLAGCNGLGERQSSQ